MHIFRAQKCFCFAEKVGVRADRLIENRGVDNFYVGGQGAFDLSVQGALIKLKAVYPHIRFAEVLVYIPPKK